MKIVFWVIIYLSFCLYGCGQEFTVVKAELKSDNNLKSDNTTVSSREVDDYLRDGLILFRQNDLEAAMDMFSKAQELDRANWQPLYYIGLILNRLEEYPRAALILNKSLDLAPKDKRTRSLVYLALGENYEGMGEFGKAELNYHTALNLNPNLSRAEEGLQRIRGRADRSGR